MVSNEATEMYLETIFLLEQKQPDGVRAVDIAREMGYSKPTISEWMTKLTEGGYISRSKPTISLTEKGRDLAAHVYERHTLLTLVFESLGVAHDIAVADACRVEHYISDETFAAMKKHYGEHLS